MAQIQTTTNQPSAPMLPIDPTPIIQSESTTSVILAIAILISILISGITGLVQLLVVTRSRR